MRQKRSREIIGDTGPGSQRPNKRQNTARDNEKCHAPFLQEDPETGEGKKNKEEKAKRRYLRWIVKRRNHRKIGLWVDNEPKSSTPRTFQDRAITRIRDEKILSDQGILKMTQIFLDDEFLANRYLFTCGVPYGLR